MMDYDKLEMKAHNSEMMDYGYNYDSSCQCSNHGESSVGHCPVCNL